MVARRFETRLYIRAMTGSEANPDLDALKCEVLHRVVGHNLLSFEQIEFQLKELLTHWTCPVSTDG